MMNNELPLGFGMALAQNMNAMQVFSNLSASEKQNYLNKAHAVGSKKEMRGLVQSITDHSSKM